MVAAVTVGNNDMSKETFLKLIITLISVHGIKLNDLRVVKDHELMLSLYQGDRGITSLIEDNRQKVAVKFVEFSALLEELKYAE